jgi:hypothetical protein
MKTRNNHEFMSAMDKVFEYIGGIPPEIWFDNDAIFCILKDKTRSLNILFSKYVKQHKFKPVFVNAASGNEKGHVENYVRIARNNLFTPIPEITNLQNYNSELLKRCDKMNSRLNIDGEKRINIFKEDKQCFLSFKLTAYLTETFICQTDVIGRIKVLQKYYYLPLKYANPIGKRKNRLTFKAVVSRHNIRVSDTKTNEAIIIFERLSEDETYYINDWGPYIKIFSSHPHLVYTTGFFETLPEIIQENYIFLNILQQKEVLRNMYIIYEKTDLETAYKVTTICLKGNRLSQHDFIMTLHNLNIDPMFMYPCPEG